MKFNNNLASHIVVISLVITCYLSGYYSWYSLHTAIGVLVVILLMFYLIRWFLTVKLVWLFKSISRPLSRIYKISITLGYILQLLVLVVLTLHGVIGMFSYNDFSYSGPLANFLYLDSAISLGRIHIQTDQGAIVLIIGHIVKEISLWLVKNKQCLTKA